MTEYDAHREPLTMAEAEAQAMRLQENDDKINELTGQIAKNNDEIVELKRVIRCKDRKITLIMGGISAFKADIEARLVLEDQLAPFCD